LVGWVAFAIFFSIFVFYAPNVLGHLDNYIPANPMSTLAHIVPKWYFLPVYAILRSISSKSRGVATIGLVFVSLFALPFINTSYIGCQPVEAPYVTIGQIASVGFFFYFAITPILGKLEARLIQNSNVSKDLKFYCTPKDWKEIIKGVAFGLVRPEAEGSGYFCEEFIIGQ
ncbi:hypothetical protein CY35_14G034200, partial [Sphagnum magellanicum]